MNLESSSSKNNKVPSLVSEETFMDDFDFKPITTGLGFHQPKQTEVKSTQYSEPVQTRNSIAPVMKKENQIYQNELSLFYGQQTTVTKAEFADAKPEIVVRNASKPQRFFAYCMDVALILSVLGLVLTAMSRTINLDLMEVWVNYPNEITPLVVILFSGFYLMYFSIFEMATQSTLGKNLLGLRVVDSENNIQKFNLLVLRSFISLTNFISLGLFSYFDLQNKITHSKVVRID